MNKPYLTLGAIVMAATLSSCAQRYEADDRYYSIAVKSKNDSIVLERGSIKLEQHMLYFHIHELSSHFYACDAQSSPRDISLSLHTLYPASSQDTFAIDEKVFTQTLDGKITRIYFSATIEDPRSSGVSTPLPLSPKNSLLKGIHVYLQKLLDGALITQRVQCRPGSWVNAG